MAKHLSVKDIKTVVNYISSLNGTAVTWDSICDAVAPLIGKRPSRQSLCKHTLVSSAYHASKSQDRQTEKPLPKPASLAIAAQRIRRLESELADVKRRNSLLYEMYMTIQYNAYKHGLKETQVLEPLPPIDRERTDRA